MPYFEKKFEKNFASTNSNSPFKIDLRCTINIETHVAMRLGELILASETLDKQLMALGHSLVGTVDDKGLYHGTLLENVVDKLDDKQWDNLFSNMEKQVREEENSYSFKAKRVASEIDHRASRPYQNGNNY